MMTGLFLTHTRIEHYWEAYVVLGRTIKEIMKVVNNLSNLRTFRKGMIWRGKPGINRAAGWMMEPVSPPWMQVYTDGSDGRLVPVETPGAIASVKIGDKNFAISEGNILIHEVSDTYRKVTAGEFNEKWFTLFNDGTRVRELDEVKKLWEELSMIGAQ